MISQTIIPKIVTEEIKKKYKRAFRGILRDICIFTHDTSKLDDLMVLTILALTLIEKTVYLFEDEDDLNSILMMLLFVSIR